MLKNLNKTFYVLLLIAFTKSNPIEEIIGDEIYLDLRQEQITTTPQSNDASGNETVGNKLYVSDDDITFFTDGVFRQPAPRNQLAEVDIEGDNRITTGTTTFYYKKGIASLYAFNVIRVSGYYWKQIASFNVKNVGIEYTVGHNVGAKRTSPSEWQISGLKPGGFDSKKEFYDYIKGAVIKVPGNFKTILPEESRDTRWVETSFKIPSSSGKYYIYQKVYKLINENYGVHSDNVVLGLADRKFCTFRQGTYEIEAMEYLQTSQPVQGLGKRSLATPFFMSVYPIHNLGKVESPTSLVTNEYLYNCEVKCAIMKISNNFEASECQISAKEQFKFTTVGCYCK